LPGITRLAELQRLDLSGCVLQVSRPWALHLPAHLCCLMHQLRPAATTPPAL
jgi:hypothetical protein